MKKAVVLTLTLLVLFASTACGSNSEDGSKAKDSPKLTSSESKIADAIAEFVATSSSDQLSKTQASCFAEAFVDEAGVKDLTEAGLIDASGKVQQSTAKFDTKLAGQYADSFLACVDYAELAAKSFATGDVSIDQAKLTSCLKKNLPDSLMRKVIIASQSGSTADTADVSEANKRLTECSAAAKGTTKK